MNAVDLTLYAVHAAYWVFFGVARAIARSRSKSSAATLMPDAPDGPVTARHARAVVVLHSVAFGVMYFAVGSSVFGGSAEHWFAVQRVAGTIVIALGAVLAAWSVMHFASWRLLAKLDTGHQLATTGPFGLMRHPIYMSFNLLALGSAVWTWNVLSWTAVVLMAVFGDIRARAEETLLRERFGPAYVAYCQRTFRFLPGLY